MGGEGLGLLGGDDGTTLDDGCHHSADSLDTEGQRSDIDEKNILGLLVGLSSENTALDGSTVSDSLIWVDASVRFLAVEEVLDELLDLRDTGGASNEHDLVNLASLEARVFEDGLDRLESVLEQIITELLKFSTC